MRKKPISPPLIPELILKRDFLRHDEPQNSLADGLQFSFMGIAHEIARKTYHYNSHHHSNHELLFIEQGSYECALNGEELRLEPGECLIVCPGDQHEDTCEPPLQFYTVWFSLRHSVKGSMDERTRILRHGLSPNQQAVRLTRETIWPLLQRIMEENEAADEFALSIQNALCHQLLWRMVRELPRQILNPVLSQSSRESKLRFRLRNTFQRFSERSTTVKEMANHLGMSESALAHQCKDLLGITPARAFLEYRIERACRLLQHTQLSVKEIAAKLGFTDAPHFIHVFRSNLGMTPATFRRDQ